MKKILLTLVVLAVGYLAVGVGAWRVLPGKIAEAERKRVGVTMALAKIANDQLLVSKRISAITAQTLNKGQDKAAQVSMLLGDPTLNRMAQTYLGADWAVVRSSFVGSVKHLRDLLRMQKADRKNYVNRLNEKIKELEREKNHLLNMSVPTYRGERDDGAIEGRGNVSQEQWHRKLKDIDRQLWAYRSSNTYREYLEKDKTAEHEVEKKAQNESVIYKLAVDCEIQTVRQLVQVMTEKATALSDEEAEPERLRHLMSYFNIWPLNKMANMPVGE